MKKTMQLRRRNERGLTLIEASMVLALAAVVVAGVMIYYQSASDNNKLTSAQSELGSIQTVVQGVYAGQQGGYPGVTQAVMNGSSAIPPNLRGASNEAVTPWGATNDVTINNAGLYATDGTTYVVTFPNVPQSDCVPLATQALGNALVSVKVGTTPVFVQTGGAAAVVGSNGEPDVTVATTACSAAGNDISWEFK
jgi:type II secretory pathway pseudopilin PulG